MSSFCFVIIVIILLKELKEYEFLAGVGIEYNF